MGDFSISILSDDMVSLAILSEQMISNVRQARKKGGVWLRVEDENKHHLSYLDPDKLIAWIEGEPIKKHAYFTKLSKKQNEEVLKLFEHELHKLFKSKLT